MGDTGPTTSSQGPRSSGEQHEASGSLRRHVNAVPAMVPSAVPKMTEETFKASHSVFCERNKVVVDRNLLQFNGKDINLHALHEEVRARGGPARVCLDYSSCVVSGPNRV